MLKYREEITVRLWWGACGILLNDRVYKWRVNLCIRKRMGESIQYLLAVLWVMMMMMKLNERKKGGETRHERLS